MSISNTRRSTPFLAALALAAAVCTAGPRLVHAQDKMGMGDTKMGDSKMAEDKMAAEKMDKMKMMAADPAEAKKMSEEQAKMMVMDHMAEEMSKDPKFQQMVMSMMADANMKKVHDDAKMMAEDPTQMQSMKSAVMADPKEMAMVEHMAAKMAMMHDGKMDDMGHGNMHDEMKK